MVRAKAVARCDSQLQGTTRGPGGTIPLEALPPVLRFVANFEPLRQVLDGVQAILYFNAAGDAGLDRGLLLTGIGLIFWGCTGRHRHPVV